MDSGILDFISEAKDSLASIETLLVRLESAPDDADLINAIFRPFHSLKGSAGFFGFNNVRLVAHKAENLLSAIRKKQVLVAPRITDALLLGRDILDRALTRIQDGDENYELRSEETEYIGALEALAAAPPSVDLTIFDELKGTLQKAAARQPDLLRGEAVRNLLDQLLVFRNSFSPAGALPDASEKEAYFYGNRELTEEIHLLRTLAAAFASGPLDAEKSAAFQAAAKTVAATAQDIPDVGEALARIEPFYPFLEDEMVTGDGGFQSLVIKEVDAAVSAIRRSAKVRIQKMGEILVEKGVVSPDVLEDVVRRQEKRKLGEMLVEEGKASERDIRESLEKQRRQIQARERKDAEQEKYIRVNQDKIDEFLHYVADGVIFAESFQYLYSLLEMTVSDAHLLSRMKESVQGLEELTRNLQDKVLSIRQIPLRQLFQKLPRMVRELSKNLGMDVNLEVFGEDLNADKNIVEKLEDPLVHMVRNALDHGLEKDQEARKAQGKPARGTLRVGAERTDEELMITVEDDGTGLPRDAILDKALEKGLVTEAHAARMSDADIFNLIFAPGFSTAATVTDVSGRGVGMDVVRSNIRDLKGRIQIESAQGRGTKFILRIPLSQVLISRDALFFSCEGEQYSIPFNEVDKAIQIPASSLTTFSKRTLFYNNEGVATEVVPFACLLAEPERAEEICRRFADHKTGDFLLIVFEHLGQHFGLLVDELLKPQKVVVRPLDKSGIPESGRELFAGSSIQGNGELVLVLSVKAVAQRILAAKGETVAEAELG